MTLRIDAVFQVCTVYIIYDVNDLYYRLKKKKKKKFSFLKYQAQFCSILRKLGPEGKTPKKLYKVESIKSI